MPLYIRYNVCAFTNYDTFTCLTHVLTFVQYNMPVSPISTKSETLTDVTNEAKRKIDADSCEVCTNV